MLSNLEKGFKIWLNEYLQTDSGNVKKNVCNQDEIHNVDLTDYILLDEKKVLSFEESVFKYLSEAKLLLKPENKPKNTCINQNHAFSHKTKCELCDKSLQSNYFKVDGKAVCFNCYFDANPRTCPVCGNDMPVSQLSSIDGKPTCKSCAKKLEISQ